LHYFWQWQEEEEERGDEFPPLNQNQAMPVSPLEAPPSLALLDDEGGVQQSTVGLHPSPRQRVEEVGKEP
jgi:hypothetical protein